MIERESVRLEEIHSDYFHYKYASWQRRLQEAAETGRELWVEPLELLLTKLKEQAAL